MVTRGRRAPTFAALLVLGLFPTAARTAAEPPHCLARLELEPRSAWVGQQVLYRLRIFRRDSVGSVDWALHPVFPGVRAEPLPGRAEDERVVRDGVAYRVREERRALFPLRAGRVEIPPSALRCALRGSAGEAVARLPGAALAAEPPPEAGRPPEFSGVIGPLLVRTSLDRPELELGESTHLMVLLLGENNVWDAPTPFRDESMPWAELFAQRPGLGLEQGPRLVVRRFFHYQLVPRRAGRFEVPEVRVDYFDPETRRYATARTAPVALTVDPRPSGASAASLGTRSRAAPPSPSREGGRALGWLAGRNGWWLGLGVAATAAAALAFHRRRAGAGEEPLLAEAAQAARTGDRERELEALARALRLALRRQFPDEAALSSCELLDRAAARSDLRELRTAAELLVALDTARFSPHGEPPDPTEIRSTLESLKPR